MSIDSKMFNITRFSLAPRQALNVLPQDPNRKYFFIANSATSLNEMYILYYQLEQTGLLVTPQDAFAIYQGGYYEPNMIPQNAISIYNNNAVNTITGFIFT